jgi:hypothetical protein
VKSKRFLVNLLFGLGSATMWSTLNKRSKFKVNFKFIVKTWNYPHKNRKGQLFYERISNYGSITHWKIARAQKLTSAPPVKSQKLDQFLRSSDLSVRDWPIVANKFIKKSTLPVLLRLLSSLYNKLEIDLEVWPLI